MYGFHTCALKKKKKLPLQRTQPSGFVYLTLACTRILLFIIIIFRIVEVDRSSLFQF